MGFEAKTGLGKAHEFGADMASQPVQGLDGDDKAFRRSVRNSKNGQCPFHFGGAYTALIVQILI